MGKSLMKLELSSGMSNHEEWECRRDYNHIRSEPKWAQLAHAVPRNWIFAPIYVAIMVGSLTFVKWWASLTRMTSTNVWATAFGRSRARLTLALSEYLDTIIYKRAKKSLTPTAFQPFLTCTPQQWSQQRNKISFFIVREQLRGCIIGECRLVETISPYFYEIGHPDLRFLHFAYKAILRLDICS